MCRIDRNTEVCLKNEKVKIIKLCKVKYLILITCTEKHLISSKNNSERPVDALAEKHQ